MVYLLNACECCILTHISPFVFASFPLSPKSFSKIVLPGKGTIGLHQLQKPYWSNLALIHLTPNLALPGVPVNYSKCCLVLSCRHQAKAAGQPSSQDMGPQLISQCKKAGLRIRAGAKGHGELAHTTAETHTSSLRTDSVSSHFPQSLSLQPKPPRSPWPRTSQPFGLEVTN